MSEDQTPQISPEDLELADRAREQKKKALKQLKDIIGIRKGTDEVRRVNGIAAALAQRFEAS